MTTLPPTSHEVHVHSQSSKSIKLITSATNSFVIPFSVILMRIRSNHYLCQTLFFIASLITNLQLLMTSTYPMCVYCWSQDPKCFNLIQVFSVFTRLLPQNLSYIVSVRASYIICLISTLSFFSIISLFFFYKPHSIFSPNSLPFLPAFSVFLLEILCFPLASLTVFFWFEQGNDHGNYPAIICTICLCFCLFGSRIYDHILHCLPNFPKLYGIKWTLPQFYIKKFLCLLTFILVEVQPHIPKLWGKILSTSVIVLIFLLLTIDIIYFCDGLIFEYNVLCTFTYFSACIFHFVSIFSFFTKERPGVYATLFIILSFPLSLLSFLFCRIRIGYFHRVFISAFHDKKYDAIDRMPVRLLLSCIGNNLHLIYNDFSILDHIAEVHSNDFDVLSLYAKFAALTFTHFSKLQELLGALKQLCNLSFAQQIQCIFLEILSLQDENTSNEQKIEEMCSIVSTEYLRNLNLFWTEILLGRTERLVSLSIAVNDKFQTAVCLFNLLGTNRGKMNHSFEQFCSISTLKISDPVFPDRYSFFKLLYQLKYQAVFFKGQKESLQEKVFRYQPPLKSVHISAYLQKFQSRIQCLKMAVLILPLICSLLFCVLGLVFTGLMFSYISPSWDLLFQGEMTGLDVSTLASQKPFLLLQYYMNFSDIAEELMNDFIFPTKMKNLTHDIVLSQEKILNRIPLFYESIEQYNHKELLTGILNTQMVCYIETFDGFTKREMDFIQYLNFIPVLINEDIRVTKDQLIQFYNSSFGISYSMNNSDTFIHTIANFLTTFPDNAREASRKEFHKTAFWIEMAMLMVIVVFIILGIILIVLLFKSYDKLFEPLFTLPKVSISELIDKLSAKPTSENVTESTYQDAQLSGNQISYNLKQLGYERPSQAFRTRTESKIIYIVSTIILLIIVRLIFCPIVAVLNIDFDRSFDAMNTSTISYLSEITIYRTLQDLSELLDRHFAQLTNPENRTEILKAQLLNDTLLLQKQLIELSYLVTHWPDLIDKQYFIISPKNAQTTLSNFTFLDKLSFLYAQMFLLLSDIYNDDYPEVSYTTVLQLMFSELTMQVPMLIQQFYSQAQSDLTWMIDKCIMLSCLAVLISFLLHILIRFSPTFAFGTNHFAEPIFASIPPRSIQQFHQFLGATDMDERERDEDPKLAMTIFETDNTFQTMMDPLILINSEGDIISMSNSAFQLFNIEKLPTNSFMGFIMMQSVEVPNFDFPIQKPHNFTFHLKQKGDPNSQTVLFANLFPTRKFVIDDYSLKLSDDEEIDNHNENDDESSEYSKKKGIDFLTVSYGCIIEDITKLSALFAQLNYEANKVRLLHVQLEPEPALDSFLNLTPFYPIMLPKLAVASFLVPSASTSLEAACYTQQAIRDALSQNPSVTFFGRSTQMFRVVSGLSNTMMSTTDASKDLVLFAQSFMRNIEQVQEHLKMDEFDARCGIHLSGPYVGDVVSDQPPVFELFGAAMIISQQIAASTLPKHVCISRDVYEAIFDQGFTITFEKEIKPICGDDMSIHNVEPVKRNS